MKIRFQVDTDDLEQSIRIFTIKATLFPEVEFREVEGSSDLLPIGRGGKRVVRVVCRRIGPEGRSAPQEVVTSPPLSARLMGPPKETAPGQGITESTIDVDVNIPANSRIGEGRGELRFRWPDGEERRRPIIWQVTPLIRANPPFLVIPPSAARTRRTVELATTARPFRVLKVTGSSLAEAPALPAARSSPSHSLDLAIDPSHPAARGPSEIRIETDDPDQPVVVVSVLILPAAEGQPE